MKANDTSAIERYTKAMHEATKRSVVVGLPQGQATSRLYEDGSTVLEIGAKHEYGYGKIPMRSFLRVPFIMCEEKLKEFIQKQFRLIAENGKVPEDALALIGVFGENVVKEAFTNSGYGNWEPLPKYTVDKKGSAQILIDKGILRSSILSEVR